MKQRGNLTVRDGDGDQPGRDLPKTKEALYLLELTARHQRFNRI